MLTDADPGSKMFPLYEELGVCGMFPPVKPCVEQSERSSLLKLHCLSSRALRRPGNKLLWMSKLCD